MESQETSAPPVAVVVEESFDIFSEYATDPVKELEGAWSPLREGKKPEILTARLGNRNYARRLAELIELHQEVLQEKDAKGKPTKAADELSDAIMAQVLAETILLGWRNMNYKGQAYSVDAATQALTHADFRRVVMERSQKFENFKVAVEEKQGNA